MPDKTITFIRGLAGYGKSTLASSLVDFETSEVVERDHFRHIYGVTSEKDITKLQREKILNHFNEEGMSHVVVSDTNLNPKYFSQFTAWAEENNLHVNVIDLRGDSPTDALENLYKAIQNDLSPDRSYPVGERVIRNQYFKYIAPTFKYEHAPDKEGWRVVICDLDGTLASDISHRSPYSTAFFELSEDKPNRVLGNMLDSLIFEERAFIHFFSGRKEEARQATDGWIRAQFLFDHGDYDITFRANDDNRKDYIVKSEMFDKKVREAGTNVIAVFDDRSQCVDLWNTLGLPVYSLNKGVWF